MLALQLAWRNLMGAKLRTFLNVIVLSFAFVLIIFYYGMIDGWNRQGRTDTIEWESGGGQYWVNGYDKYNPFTIQESHRPLGGKITKLIQEGKITPILLNQASIFPQDRMQSVILKGVDTNQKILKLPTNLLQKDTNGYSAMIGKRMAETSNLKVGDEVLMRWKDKNGSFDAADIKIAAIFKCDVPSIDNGQLYLDIDLLRKMSGLENEASILVVSPTYKSESFDDWVFKDNKTLLADFDKLIKSKKMGGMIMEGLLLLIALLAIFDTQVLSIFRRQKEIGTYIALGMTRWQVVGIFTIEGTVYSIIALVVGALYGIPLFLYMNSVGISFGTPDMGITIADTIYPYYSLTLIITTILFIVIAATIVSYLPAKKISKLNPTQALKGKLQ